MVSNLVDNAIKYLGPERFGVAVELGQTAGEGRKFASRPWTRHIGIACPKHKEQFKRSRSECSGTTAGSRVRAGTVHSSVVERHGGKVFAESEGPGRGSTFTCMRPCAAMSRILVVEDEQHLADGLRYNLEVEQTMS